MIKYTEYDMTNQEECPSYFLSRVNDEDERTFLVYIKSIQDIVIKLKYNIEVLDYMLDLYSNLVENNYKTFFMLLMENISAQIAIDARSLLEDGGDQINLNELKHYCRKCPEIFKYNDIIVLSKNLFSKSKKLYKDYLYFPSNKVFAHNTQEKLFEVDTGKNFNKLTFSHLEDLLKDIIVGLNAIWFSYSQQEL